MKKNRKKTKVKRLRMNEVAYIAEMQCDLDYMTQFIVNVSSLFMGKKPAMLVNCSQVTEAICKKCWSDCVRVYERLQQLEKQNEGAADVSHCGLDAKTEG